VKRHKLARAARCTSTFPGQLFHGQLGPDAGAQAIAGGLAECVIVVGFEQMEAGALSAKWTDRANPLDKFVSVMNEEQGFNQAPPAAQMFGGAGREYRWKHGTSRPVDMAAQTMTTDYPSSFEEHSMIKMVGYDMVKAAAAKVYEQAGIGPDDVDVVELHDCFTANELSPTRRSACARRARPRSSSGTATTPTAVSSSPIPRAASCPRATRSAPPASRSAPSSSGTCAARPRLARSRAPRSPSSTTSASAAPATSPCTAATDCYGDSITERALQLGLASTRAACSRVRSRPVHEYD